MAAAILAQESQDAAQRKSAQQQVHALWVPTYQLIDLVAPEGVQALKSLGLNPFPWNGRRAWDLELFKVEFRRSRGMLRIFLFEDGSWERSEPEPPDLLESANDPPLIIEDVHEARVMLQNAIIERRKGWGRKNYFTPYDLE